MNLSGACNQAPDLKFNIMTTVSTYLDEKSKEELLSIFENTYQGLQTCTGTFLVLRRKALREIKGMFTISELHALIDIHNATIFDPQVSCISGALIASVEDANNFDGLCTKWGVNFDSLLEKLKRLNDFQSFFLSFECYAFWYGKNAGNNLDEFVKRF